MPAPVLELRVALTAQDYNQIFSFYSEGLGIDPAELWTDTGNAAIFEMGRATLEIFDEEHASTVDQIEAGQRTSGQIRFALQVLDVDAAVRRLIAKGATLVHEPVMTPWGDYNARLQAPDGLQITLFQNSKNS
jgi:predicted enzyme related to lactoylglutathione lyase